MGRTTISENELRLLQEKIASKNKAQLSVSPISFNGSKRILLKPMSLNEGYTGKRYKTKEHRVWHNLLLSLLPYFKLPEPPYELTLKFGFATGASDGDNCIKFVQDCLGKKYGFNDKKIKRWIVDTEVVGAGNEYIEWDLKTKKS